MDGLLVHNLALVQIKIKPWLIRAILVEFFKAND